MKIASSFCILYIWLVGFFTVLGAVFFCLRISTGFSVQQILQYVGQKGSRSFTLDLQVGKWAIVDGGDYDVRELENKPARPFFSFTAPLYFQVQEQACVPFTVASSLAVLVNSQEQRVLYCYLLRLHWQPSRPSFFSLYRLAFLVNPRDKLIKTTCVAFHSKMAGIVSGLVKIEWTLYCTFLLLAWTQHYDYSPPSQYCLQLSRQK